MSEFKLKLQKAGLLIALDDAWLAFVRAEAACRDAWSKQSYAALRRTEKELVVAARAAALCPEHDTQPLLGCAFHREDAEQIVREQGEMR